MLSNLTLSSSFIKCPFPQTQEHTVFQKKDMHMTLTLKKMFQIIQNDNNSNKNVNENVTELPFLNHHITKFLCCGQHILLLRLRKKSCSYFDGKNTKWHNLCVKRKFGVLKAPIHPKLMFVSTSWVFHQGKHPAVHISLSGRTWNFSNVALQYLQ